MILIISSADDNSTNDVIDWIRYRGFSFVRVDYSDVIDLRFVQLRNCQSEIGFSIKGKSYKLSEFESIWYRRSWIRLKEHHFKSTIGKKFDKTVNRQLKSELDELYTYFQEKMSTKSLNKPQDVKLNKLSVLQTCIELKIAFPNTIITSRKEEVEEFHSINKDIITKNFSQGIFIKHEGFTVGSLTTKVNTVMIKSLPDLFSPMLFQEYIKKAFEVRAFFLDNEFYCIAIFSQNDEKTKVDFRNYNREKPNRTLPYELPKPIHDTYKELMQVLGLNSGSLDILVSASGDYYFLEVNPIGQFAQVSKPCNYYLEEKIFKYLIVNEKQNY